MALPRSAPALKKHIAPDAKALTRARKDPRPENYHELRKRVKDHWYHIRLLESLWTGMMSAYEKSLKDLETWLGNDHNLAVLREKIVAEPAFYGKQKDIDLTLDLIDRYQKELRRQIALAGRADLRGEAARVYSPHETPLGHMAPGAANVWKNLPGRVTHVLEIRFDQKRLRKPRGISQARVA